ncbi:MAG: nuclear transport factor 2 family protein [Methylococcales bacterium]
MDSVIQQLKNEREIIQLVNNIAIFTDMNAWEDAVTCFTDEVIVDYVSMFGGTANTLKATEMVENWKFLAGFKATHHVISNHKVTINGDNAACFSYIDAHHYLPVETGESIWIVIGYYNHDLILTAEGWKVTRIKLNATIVTGNNQLLKELNPATYHALQDKWKKWN